MASKDDPLDIVKNGQPIRAFQINPAGRIYPVTPDGSQWEVRIHMMADISKLAPEGPQVGDEIIGEVVIRTFNGGVAPLKGMAMEASKVTDALVKRILGAMQEAAKQQAGGIQVVSGLPQDLKNRN